MALKVQIFKHFSCMTKLPLKRKEHARDSPPNCRYSESDFPFFDLQNDARDLSLENPHILDTKNGETIC